MSKSRHGPIRYSEYLKITLVGSFNNLPKSTDSESCRKSSAPPIQLQVFLCGDSPFVAETVSLATVISALCITFQPTWNKNYNIQF